MARARQQAARRSWGRRCLRPSRVIRMPHGNGFLPDAGVPVSSLADGAAPVRSQLGSAPPIRPEAGLPGPGAERRERVVHTRDRGVFFRRSRCRLSSQPPVQPAAACMCASLVSRDTTGGRIQPWPSVVPSRHVVEPPPGDQEHLGDRILRIAAGMRAPPTVRGDALDLLAEQRIEAPPAFAVCFRQSRLLFGVAHLPRTCPRGEASVSGRLPGHPWGGN